ncbi:HlyD family secretion protein [Stratiformator vulcanicus]|uniref:Multidrug resistance protein MdtN n=1 Tax=Stratiformator vulcanicus TaxID=2527980 RepID=A0A517QWG1_9PLAN|nr:HlyD family efflux transporter periplasmic adaptor subunit [Stratiformator vulcanicus]QDT35927.1 multidrug resistance protein MdtN [Stratiformator vulcanicus]
MATTTIPSTETEVNGEAPPRSGMLLPVAYSDALMPSLRLTKTSARIRRIAKVLFALLSAAIICMAVAPWQQSVYGSGNVFAYAPGQRQQVIQSPIKGRIARLGEGIFENARVKKGQLIAEIRDLDESYADRLQSQLDQSKLSLESAKTQLRANTAALEAAKTVVESSDAQIRAYRSVKEQTIAAQDAYVIMAQRKVSAEEQQLAEYKAAIPQLEAQLDRIKTLKEEGNVSVLKYEEVKRKVGEAKAKVSRAENYVGAAESELIGKQRERTAKIEKAQVDIDYATATLRKAKGDVSKAEGAVAKAEQEVNKAEQELLKMQTDVSRQDNGKVLAPFDGFVVKIIPNMGTAVLKQGDPICTIVPETTDRAVQIWLDGNDAPLVEPGRHARLQFEGWPAVQFSGWPSVAVGTFGGEVISIDAVDNGRGQFRVLILPDPDDVPWPDERFLRQGVRANAWVLLDRVPLWFEVWRRLNGFPPVYDADMKTEKPSKPPKIPK